MLENGLSNEKLGERTVLSTLSATDFCLQLSHRVYEGEKLLVITQLSHAFLLLRGEVMQVQKAKAGSYSLSLNIQQHQIFSLTDRSLKNFYDGNSLTPSQMSDGPVSLEFSS